MEITSRLSHVSTDQIAGFYKLRLGQKLRRVREDINRAQSPEEAIRVALQFGVIHTLGARAAQMYWVNRDGVPSVKTMAVYKWLRMPVIHRFEQRDLSFKPLYTLGDRTLVELDPDSSEVTKFANKTTLTETREMAQVVADMKPHIAANN